MANQTRENDGDQLKEWVNSMLTLLKSVDRDYFMAKTEALLQALANQTKKNDGDQLNDWVDSMRTLLKSVDRDYIQSCSISIVPEGLKEWNEDAYMPRVVSIGPRFKGSREDLLLMEETKLTCMLSLIHRGEQGNARKSLEDCSKAIWELDKEVRASYVANIKLGRHELAKIMLLDGCFVLELLISKGLDAQLPSRLIPPGPAPEVLKHQDVLSDLTLLENQVPICVLHELSQTLFPNLFKPNDGVQRATKINNLALSMLGYSHSQPQVQVQVPSLEAPHILDLVHSFVNRKGERHCEDGNHAVDIKVDTNRHGKLKLKRCASRLQAAGVTIKLPEDTDSGLSCFNLLRNCFGGPLIRLGNIIVTAKQAKVPEVRGLDFDFKFEQGKLEIAQLHITETTKAKWRNVIAWEHHKKNWKSSSVSSASGQSQSAASRSGKFTSSALIFDGLICCAADVKLLKDKNIIVDHVKMSNEELEAFFRTISFGVDHGVVDSSFVKLVEHLNKYSEAFFLVRIWKTLWHLFTYGLVWLIKFMNSNYNFVATVLAALTVVQTVYAILAYYMTT